jgi:excisionase family DNA binding protein
MKTSEAAHLCRVTAETVIAWAKAGKLHATRTPGGHYRFDPAEVHELMNADALQSGEMSLTTQRAAP